MRILLVHNRYRSTSPGGEDRVVDQEHEALEMAGHEVRRFERANDDIAGYPWRQKVLVPVEAVWSRRSARALDAALETLRPDVVHVHNLFPLVSGSALHSCARNQVPCVATFHNYLQVCVVGSLHRAGGTCTACVGRSVPAPGIRHGCYHGSAAASAVATASVVSSRSAWRTIPSAYVLLSHAQRRLLEPLGLPPWRCFVKSNLVHPTLCRTSPENLVVFAGRLTEAKGLRVLMRAWDRYTESTRDPRLRLAIAGSGPLEAEVRSWAAGRRSVEVHGLLGRDATAQLVARATAVVVPSEWQEPFGLVVAEAMAAGVGPVATAHGSFPELIEDRVDGLLYPPGDDAALAAIVRRLEESPELVTSLGEAARRTYERRFTPAKIVAQLEDIYRFALDNPTWRQQGPVGPRASAVGAAGAEE